MSHPIEALKALEAQATPGPWELAMTGCSLRTRAVPRPYDHDIIMQIHPDDFRRKPEKFVDDASLVEALRNLAPELIALWQAAQAWHEPIFNGAECAKRMNNLQLAYLALNDRAAEVLK